MYFLGWSYDQGIHIQERSVRNGKFPLLECDSTCQKNNVITSHVNFTVTVGCDCQRFEIQFKIRAKGGNLFTSQTKRCFWCGVTNRLWKKPHFQLFALAKNLGLPNASNAPLLVVVEWLAIIVICALHVKNIIEEQITSNDFNLSAAKLKFEDEMLYAIQNCEIQVIFAAVKQVLNEKFTSMTVLFIAHCPLLMWINQVLFLQDRLLVLIFS